MSLTSCSHFRREKTTLDYIDNYYQERLKTVRERLKDEKQKEVPKSSFSAKNMAFADFVVLLSDQFGKSIVFESSLDSVTITAEFKDASLDDILGTVSRRYQKDLVKVNEVYFLGSIDLRDTSVLVTRIKGQSIEDIRGIFLSLSVDNKEEFFVSSRGIVVIRDKQHIINSYLKVLDFLKNDYLDSYFCELYVFRMSNSFFKKLKIDSKFSASYIATKDTSNFNFLLNSLIDFSYDISDVSLTVKPSFMLQYSQPAEFSDTTSLFFETRKTTESGVTESDGFQEIVAGKNIKLTLREGDKQNTLQINYEDSIITDIDDDSGLPTIDRIRYSSRVTLNTSGTYLLAQISSDQNLRTDHIITDSVDDKSTVTQVFAKIYKIDSNKVK